MQKMIAALIDLACGVVFLGIAFFGARVLLQSTSLVYLFFPILCTAAFAFGWWRGRTAPLPLAVTVVLAALPLLILAIRFFSGRNRPFMVLPFVTAIFILAGAAIGRMRRSGLAAAVAVVMFNAAGALAGPAFITLIVPSRDVKETAKPFEIRLVDGRTITSAELRGRVVVLDFWATWCVPCQHELPEIQRAYERLKGRNDVAIFAVDGTMTDNPGDVGDTPERAVEFFRRGGFTIPLAYDRGAVLEKSFALSGFPTLLVLDREGSVRIRHVGYIGSENLEETLLRKVDELR